MASTDPRKMVISPPSRDRSESTYADASGAVAVSSQRPVAFTQTRPAAMDMPDRGAAHERTETQGVQASGVDMPLGETRKRPQQTR